MLHCWVEGGSVSCSRSVQVSTGPDLLAAASLLPLRLFCTVTDGEEKMTKVGDKPSEINHQDHGRLINRLFIFFSLVSSALQKLHCVSETQECLLTAGCHLLLCYPPKRAFRQERIELKTPHENGPSHLCQIVNLRQKQM